MLLEFVIINTKSHQQLLILSVVFVKKNIDLCALLISLIMQLSQFMSMSSHIGF